MGSAQPTPRRTRVPRLIALLLPLLLAGCSALDIVNALSPRDGYNLTRDLAYGPLKRQKLDVYVPDIFAPGAPVVIFFHGGRWQEGSKDDYRFAAQALASRGFVTILPNYRLFPQVRFPTFVLDSADAVAWVYREISAYGGNPERIYLMGHSAGAHIAALLALDEHYLYQRVPTLQLAGLIGLAGPYDFLPLTDADLQAIFAPPQDWPLSQPIEFVDGNEAPMLLLYGDEDTSVKPHNLKNLARRVRERGGQVDTIVYPDVDHAEIVGALARPLRFLAPVLDDSAGFIERLGATPPPVAAP